MFDNKDIQEYQSIVVPSGLKSRIERDCLERQHKPRVIGGSGLRRWALPMAACLILLCTVFLNLPIGGNTPMLSYGGVPVTAQGTPVRNESRASYLAISEDEVLFLALTVEGKGTYFVSVSDGAIAPIDEEENIATAGVEKEMKGKCELLWTLDLNGESSPEIRVRANDKTLTYVLTYDENAEGYVLYER